MPGTGGVSERRQHGSGDGSGGSGTGGASVRQSGRGRDADGGGGGSVECAETSAIVSGAWHGARGRNGIVEGGEIGDGNAGGAHYRYARLPDGDGAGAARGRAHHPAVRDYGADRRT